MNNRLTKVIGPGRVIAATRDPAALKTAAASRAAAVFILAGDIIGIGAMVAAVREAGKPVFVHMELIEGLAGDQAGVRFIAQRVRPDGIITTRSHLIGLARKEGLITIQRLFIVDSQAVATGIAAASAGKPDAAEVLPGVIPRAVAEMSARLDVPIIAGGLIRSTSEIDEALKAGAHAVSLSMQGLWDYQPEVAVAR